MFGRLFLDMPRCREVIQHFAPRQVGKGTPYTRLVADTGQIRQRFPSRAEAWPWREVLELFLGLLDVASG